MADEIPQIPPIPKSVYRAAREASRESQEVDDRIACATEATWIRAWRAAMAGTTETTIEYGHTCQSDAGTYICWCGAGPDSPSAQFQRTVTVTYGPIEPVGPGASEDHSSQIVEVDKGV